VVASAGRCEEARLSPPRPHGERSAAGRVRGSTSRNQGVWAVLIPEVFAEESRKNVSLRAAHGIIKMDCRAKVMREVQPCPSTTGRGLMPASVTISTMPGSRRSPEP